ncbi:hypothetical protein NDU88_003197 [Pleurodeles waltl]|uniref:Uncharacterized protein n=1 Tax=Pleurodeles waltl TaxID=8319 RepID=A0AAV7P8W6_PLEWA|nr:hypothetical protein NDU88_003197 [Pleurodeles waltl]
MVAAVPCWTKAGRVRLRAVACIGEAQREDRAGWGYCCCVCPVTWTTPAEMLAQDRRLHQVSCGGSRHAWAHGGAEGRDPCRGATGAVGET